MSIRIAGLLAALAISAAADDLTGRVLEDHSNNPLASVELKVYRVGQRQLAAHLETDASGTFSAAALAPGEYRIEAAKPNFIGTTLRLSAVRTGLVIRLVRCGVISGQVVDVQGQPIPGAAVYVMPKPGDGGPLRQLSSGRFDVITRVDAQGRYRIHNLAPGEYAIAATYGASTSSFGSSGGGVARPGLGSGVQFYPSNAQPRFFTVAGGEEYRNIDFAVSPGALYNISGKMELPAPKTRLWLALTNPAQPSLAVAVASTKDDGGFQFEGIAPGNYTLTAAGPTRGYGGRAVLDPQPFFGRTQVSVGGANLEGVSVAIQRGRAVSLILKQPPDGCPATAEVTLIAVEDWAADLNRTVEVNAQKPQTVDHVAPARFQVLASRLGETCYQPATTTVDFSAALPEAPITVVISSAGAIHGKLTGTAKPTEFAVALVPGEVLADARPVQIVFPDANGRFIFASLRPGPYRIAAQPVGEASRARWVREGARMIEIQIPAGAPTDVELPAPPVIANK